MTPPFVDQAFQGRVSLLLPFRFLLTYLPFFLFFQLTSILVVAHKSRLFRLATLPFTLWAAFRLVNRVQLEMPVDTGMGQLKLTTLVLVASLTMRAFGWTFDGQRHQRLDDHTQYTVPNRRLLIRIVVESFALSFNVRGVGWNWGKEVHPITCPLTSRSTYIYRRAASILVHVTIVYLARNAVNYLMSSQNGGSLYDMSLPFIARHTLASLVSLLLAVIIYVSMDTSYSIVALISVLLLGHDPASWPPIFDSPWLSTSLVEFWGKRWHQMLRHGFVSAGGRPLGLLFGRVGYVLGTFLMSGFAHALCVWDTEDKTDFMIIVGGFLAMGAGIILEFIWRIGTGCRVGGVLGRIWMLTWLAGWFNLMFDVWSRRRMIETNTSFSIFLTLFPPVLR